MEVCPECGAKIEYTHNVAEDTDWYKCTLCPFIEPVCNASTCGGL